MNDRDKIQRTVLPIPDQLYVGLTTYDAKDPDTKYPPIKELRPPTDAPNVLVILIDDCGFGATSAFGGPCRTPNFEKLAADGLRYTRFHTTALCSPTRQALLSGRNHHSAGMGGITEIATSAPGYNSLMPNTMSPLAQTLKLNGYSTAQFGKCHEVPVWQTSPMGTFDHWPSGGGGFEHFYGFIGGETNQWYPALYENVTPVEPDKTPEQGYHLTGEASPTRQSCGLANKIAHAGQAVLHVLRTRRNARPTPCAQGMDKRTRVSLTRGGTNCAKRRLRGRRSSALSRRTAN